MSLIFGLITGILFGFILQRSGILSYEKQVGALRLIDMAVFKLMLSAIIVGAIGIYFFYDIGVIKLSLKATSVGGQVAGGLIFGVGWALLGYCPGISAGALGEGHIDALWGMFGMLFGGAVYAVIYPFMKKYIISIGSYGKISLPQILGVNHWIVIVALTILILVMFIVFEKKRL
ncbi:MAG: YeeE/YedE family protein [Desulfobacteraceae bacterium]|nr:YeeE/YedE family protein [Desulfobacteraceae bacterium]